MDLYDFLYLELDNDVERLYAEHKQTKEIYEVKEKLRKRLEQHLMRQLKQELHPVQVFIMGSSWNSEIALKDSDLDLAVHLPNVKDWDDSYKLNKLRWLIDEMQTVSQLQIIGKNPPVLQFKMDTGFGTKMKVDLQMYSLVPAKGKALIRQYIRADERFAKLAVALKVWAEERNMHNASEGKLSSHGLVLMLIQFLQAGCSPPVLPCMHELIPEAIEDPNPWVLARAQVRFRSANEESVGDLFHQFFEYYTYTFDFRASVVSVASGKPQRRTGQWTKPLVCIEEPIAKTNVAKAVKCPDTWDYILDALTESFEETEPDMDQAFALRHIHEKYFS